MAKQKVSIYDPVRKAFFEADIEVAREFVEAAKSTEKKIKKIDEENAE